VGLQSAGDKKQGVGQNGSNLPRCRLGFNNPLFCLPGPAEAGGPDSGAGFR
jgi:hypothetical protein